MNSGLFYLSDRWYSQNLPDTEDGCVYIYLGLVCSGSNFTMSSNHPIYEYKDGRLRQYGSVSKAEIQSALGYDLEDKYLQLSGGNLTGDLVIDADLEVNGGVTVDNKVKLLWNNDTSSLDFIFM